jgi:hypothetical protein
MRIWGNVVQDGQGEQLNTDEWYLFTWASDGSDIKWYINGEHQMTTGAESSAGFTGDLYIGMENRKETANAYLDDARIYNRALSEDEVKYLYEVTAPNYE